MLFKMFYQDLRWKILSEIVIQIGEILGIRRGGIPVF